VFGGGGLDGGGCGYGGLLLLLWGGALFWCSGFLWLLRRLRVKERNCAKDCCGAEERVAKFCGEGGARRAHDHPLESTLVWGIAG